MDNDAHEPEIGRSPRSLLGRRHVRLSVALPLQARGRLGVLRGRRGAGGRQRPSAKTGLIQREVGILTAPPIRPAFSCARTAMIRPIDAHYHRRHCSIWPLSIGSTWQHRSSRNATPAIAQTLSRLTYEHPVGACVSEIMDALAAAAGRHAPAAAQGLMSVCSAPAREPPTCDLPRRRSGRGGNLASHLPNWDRKGCSEKDTPPMPHSWSGTRCLTDPTT